MKQFLNVNIKKVVLGIVAAFVIVVAVISALNQNDLKIQEPDTTVNTQVAEQDSTEPTDEVEQSTEESSSDVAEEFEPELTEEASSADAKDEPSTKKPETTTKKQETTTKKPVETTTEKITSTITYNGHKPYEIFADETGTLYYYTESGRLCCAETLTTEPPDTNYDASYCHTCGSKDCVQAVNTYFCVTCEKDIPASTCHPKSHYNASH